MTNEVCYGAMDRSNSTQKVGQIIGSASDLHSLNGQAPIPTCRSGSWGSGCWEQKVMNQRVTLPPASDDVSCLGAQQAGQRSFTRICSID